MITFEKSELIDCDLEEIFEFHCDTNNLPLISPSYIKVKIIKIDKPIRLNSEIIVRVSQLGFLYTNWFIKVSKFEKNKIITDYQVKGPFKHWEHSHIFESVDGKVKMTDLINYELPFGFIGKFVNSLFLNKIIENQFKFRHKKTKELFENKKNA